MVTHQLIQAFHRRIIEAAVAQRTGDDDGNGQIGFRQGGNDHGRQAQCQSEHQREKLFHTNLPPNCMIENKNHSLFRDSYTKILLS